MSSEEETTLKNLITDKALIPAPTHNDIGIPLGKRLDQASTELQLGRVRSASEMKYSRQMKADGWMNLLTGLGGKMDKRNYSHYSFGTYLTDPELEQLYLGDGIATRVVDIVADDMTREWVTVKSARDESDDDSASVNTAIDKINQTLESLNAESVFNEALKWKRLYGGSIIIVGALDGSELDKPLNVNRVSSVDYLTVVDRSDVDIFQSTFELDPSKPNFGEPIQLYVYLQMGSFRYPKLIHASRCIILKGKRIPKGMQSSITLEQRFWGISVLQSAYESIRDFSTALDGVTNVLQEFIIGKFKMAGLADKLASGKESEIMTRMEIISASKSVIQSVLLDAELEDYIRETANLSGIPDTLDRYMMRVSSTTGIPVTKLFGRSPAGLNATGESDQTSYYDIVRSEQKTDLKPAIMRLLGIVAASLRIKTPLDIEFNALIQTTDKEKADLEKVEIDAENVKATMYKTYSELGVLEPEQIFALEWKDKLEGVEVPQLPGLDMKKQLEDLQAKLVEAQTAKQQPPSQQPTQTTPQKVDGASRVVSLPFRLELVEDELKQDFVKDPKTGQFTNTPGGSKNATKGMIAATGDLPEHIKSMKIPPAWKDVKYSPDPNANLLVTGRDAKGRMQYVYNAKYVADQASAKFGRVAALNSKFDMVQKQNNSNMKKGVEEAFCLDLVMKTGVRPGSDKDTKAKKKAYGATTLEARHVVVDSKGKVTLQFTGKKGVEQKVEVSDASLASELKKRKQGKQPTDRVFNTSERQLSEYTKKLDGGGFHTKDLRTRLGTVTAAEAIAAIPVPKDAKSYKKAVKQVADIVSAKLGNTPTIALQSYINPAVFEIWRSAL